LASDLELRGRQLGLPFGVGFCHFIHNSRLPYT
jgi:hypothetical protein